MSDAVTIIAIICYVEWGLIHIAAAACTWTSFPGGTGGSACFKGSAAGGLVPTALMKALTPEEQEALTSTKYANYSHRIYIQHGWNLGTAGVWSILSIVPLLYKTRLAWWFGLNQYLFDWGYFIGIDWVGKGGPMGQAQTFIVSAGLLCSALSVNNAHDVPEMELFLTILTPCLLIAAGLFCMIRERTCPTCMDCSGPEPLAESTTEPGKDQPGSVALTVN